MSYDVYLNHPITKETLEVDQPLQMRGGTYQVGGTTQMRLNVTYNYNKYYGGLGEEGLSTLNGMNAADSIPLLQKVIESLGDDMTDDYWEPTEGNCKAALLQLLALAKMRPDGVWEVD